MEIDVRAVGRLRESAGARAAIAPMVESLVSHDVDLSAARAVCDWIQYKANFREAVMVRPVLSAGGVSSVDGFELAVDLRRCARPEADVAAEVTAALSGAGHLAGGAGADDRVWLEPWAPGSASCVWRFNALYWQALAAWEKATGKEYEQSLPGGASDARNSAAAREVIGDLFSCWDELAARRALPEELYVIELGVGNGGQARTWLDEFAELDRRHGRDYYRRLRYLMGDYSPHVLDRARQEVAHHGDRVSGLVLEATRLSGTVGFLAGKAFLVYISNVYDNLPSDEVAVIRGRVYLVQARSYLTGPAADSVAARFGVQRQDIAQLTRRLLRIGPDLLAESQPGAFPDAAQAVAFWQAVWESLRQAERYVPLEGLDTYRVTPSVTGEILRPLLAAEGDVRMHVSNGALSSFADTLPLLHPFGKLVCHDLFTTAPGEYRAGFFGPGKYDGSVVNWVNGPLLQLLASRRGFGVRFSPFTQRPASNVKTLTAQVRDLAMLLPTTVVGSYSVPEWLERLKTEYYQRRISAAHLQEIHDVAIKAAVKDQERAGIDIVSDGELRRDNDIDYFLARVPGVHIAQRAKSDYYDYYEAAVTAPLPAAGPAPGQGAPGGEAALPGLGLAGDFAFTRALTDRPVKFSFTGPFSLARRVSVDEHAYKDQADLVRDLARLLNREARSLADAGARFLQVDEPFLAGYPEQAALAVEAVNIVTDGVPATWALHVCYGNRYARPSWEGHYDFLFPAVLSARVDQLVLEFARKGLDDLRLIREYGWPSALGLGVIDVKSPAVESPGLVAARIRRALEYVDPARLVINPDCGLRHLAPEVARSKLRAMVAGAAIVRSELSTPPTSPSPATGDSDSQLTGDKNVG